MRNVQPWAATVRAWLATSIVTSGARRRPRSGSMPRLRDSMTRWQSIRVHYRDGPSHMF